MNPNLQGRQSKVQYLSVVAEFLNDLRYGRKLSERTFYTYQAALRAYEKWLAEQGEPDPTYQSVLERTKIRKYQYVLSGRGLAAKTVRGAIIAIRQLCKYLVQEGALAEDPCATLKMPKKNESRRYTATDSEVEAMLAVCGRMYNSRKAALSRMALSCMIFAGLLASEVCNVRMEHCKPEAGELLVENGKGGKSATLYPPNEFWEAYAAWIAERGKIAPKHEYLLAQAVHKRLGYEGLRKIVAEVRLLANIPNAEKITAHGLRHNFACYMHKNGATINQVQAALRHKQTHTTFQYLHLADGDTQAMQQLASRSGKPEQTAPAIADGLRTGSSPKAEEIAPTRIRSLVHDTRPMTMEPSASPSKRAEQTLARRRRIPPK